MGHDHSHLSSRDNHLLYTNQRGIQALKISFIGLIATAVFQAAIVFFSGSAALLADTLHNFMDAFTAVPLWVAFLMARRRPSRTFTYGYNRLEDLVGLLIVLLIFITAVWVGYDSIQKIQIGFVPKHLNWVIAAAVIGFVGNEVVARYRIKIGKEIKSAALVADGYHARADGFTSLGVLIGTIGVMRGYPIADPLIGLAIAVAIVHIGWTSGKELMTRLMDAITPEIIDQIQKITRGVDGVMNVADVRARMVGQQMRMDLTIEVDGNITVKAGHEIAVEVHHALNKAFPELVSPNIHVDPKGMRGEEHHFHPSSRGG